MSGIATRAEFALLDTRNGLDLDTYATFAELAAMALYQHATGCRGGLPWPEGMTEAQRCDQLLARVDALAEETRQAVIRSYDPARLHPPEVWPWLDRQSGAAIHEDRWYGFCDSGGLWGGTHGFATLDDALCAARKEMRAAQCSSRPQDLGEIAVCVLSGREYVDRVYEVCAREGETLADYGNWTSAEQPPARGPYMLAMDKLQEALRELDGQGYVVTVEQKPLHPLAMGNYVTCITTREKRGRS